MSTKSKHLLGRSMFLVLVVVFLGTIILTPTANAGTNGQQVYANSAQSELKIVYFRVVGPNQNGQTVSNRLTFPYPGVYSAYMSNWWWKGNVNVTIGLYDYVTTGHTKVVTCTISVPTSQSSNWVRVRANWNGCWKG